MADRSAIKNIGPLRKEATLIEIQDATFRGETTPIEFPAPVATAQVEAYEGSKSGDDSDGLSESAVAENDTEESSTENPDRFLLGLHAIDPPLGSGDPSKRDSLLGISDPLPPGSNANVQIPVWYRNPFPIDKTPEGPIPSWTPIRDYPGKDEHSLEKGEQLFISATGPIGYGDYNGDYVEVAVTLWHGPPPEGSGKMGPILDNEDNLISDEADLEVDIGSE